jgi:hypothetical protein
MPPNHYRPNQLENQWGDRQAADQLEFELTLLIEAARSDLDAADIVEIVKSMVGRLEYLSDREQLRIAGTTLLRLAEVCELRAAQLCDDWEAGQNQIGLMITDELLNGLVQKTTQIDISELLADPLPRRKKKLEKLQPQDSIAGEVNKSALLQVLDAIAEEATQKEEALKVAHDEDVSKWIGAIAEWMAVQQVQTVSLLELRQAIGLPLVEVWLALLLGDYRLESRGQFYDASQIWIKRE